MRNLVIKSERGNAITTSLLVAEKFNKQHKSVLRDIHNLSASKDFREHNFAPSSYVSEQNKDMPMYFMTKDGFTFLVMGYTGKKAGIFKEDYIREFNEMDTRLRALNIPETLYEALMLAAAKVKEIAEKDAKLAIQAPKVSFADRVIDLGEDTTVDVGQAAKLLKLPFGRNTLFFRLREDGIFFNSRNEPKQQYINQGYFELRQKLIQRDSHKSFVVTKILVTQKGLYWLSKKYGGNLK